MFSKSFLQERFNYFMKDYMKDDLFPTTIGLVLPQKKGGTLSNSRTWNITALVTNISQEDSTRLSIEGVGFRTVDVFLDDLTALKTANPTAYIITKNFQKNAEVVIDGSRYKIREERATEGFEKAIRFICELQVQ